MFVFDATTVAIILPSTILWILLLAAQRKKEIDFSTCSLRKIPKLPQLKIYGLCLGLAGILFCLLNSLNPLRAPIELEIHKWTIWSGLSLLSYVAVCISMVMPFFHLLQGAFNQRFLHKSNLHFSKFEHMLLFCTVALYVLPLFEALRFSLGYSPFPAWLVKDIFRVCVAFSTFPLSLLGVLISFKPGFYGPEFKGVNREQILSYIEFLKDRNFDPAQLEQNPDHEIITIIAVAKQIGDLDKAELLSETLMNR